MSLPYYSELFPVLTERSKLASISRLGFANIPLRRHLADLFSRPYGEDGSFLADPAFEAVFGWQADQLSMGRLADEEKLLHPDLVAAMDKPPKELAEQYRFSREVRPYTHQVEAWHLLAQHPPKSLMVSSGTGSGKTECFMVPILDHLVRLREQQQGRLIGVRALFLYPLNALINSQRERLRAWTHAFGQDIRFCLYNGNTPEMLPAHKKQSYPAEVQDRKTLRVSPPPILVTNPTMLEYMLVRTVDRPILEQSQGKLEWIVLDEAHTYVGSQAAEAALLIRRVLLAFGAQPQDVHFIATSATIGDPEGRAGQELKTFLAEVAGVPLEQIHLVTGTRQIPELPPKKKKKPTAQTLDELNALDTDKECSNARYRATAANSIARSLRSLFTDDPRGKHVVKLSEVCRQLFPEQKSFNLEQQLEALRWLDLLSGTRKESRNNRTADSFLPLRAHLFHQTLSGIWACADPDCPEKKNTELANPQWPFGNVYLAPRKHCRCHSPVYEVVRCNDCGMVYLLAEEQQGILNQFAPLSTQDEFELEVEHENSEEASNDPGEERDKYGNGSGNCVIIANRNMDHVRPLDIDRHHRTITEAGEEVLRLLAHEAGDDGLICPACEKQEGAGTWGPLFRMSRLGAPFLLSVILPTLLEFAPDGTKPADHPCRGRRLLTFNDSRQGTARMAVKLQQEAERSHIRSLIYHHALQYAQSGGGDAAEKTAELESLQQIHAATPNPDLEKLIERKRAELEQLQQPKPIPFDDLINSLSEASKDFDNMIARYRDFAPSVFGGDIGRKELAAMLLVREFGRRPKLLNSLESMGMVAVRYPALDQLDTVPELVVQAAHFDKPAWLDFLKLCLDFFVRSGGSLRITPEWRRWLGLPFRQSWLIPYDAKDVGSNQRRWPKTGRSGKRATLVRLLAYVLKLDIKIDEGKDRIDAVLQAAWKVLTDKGLLQLTPDGYILPRNQLAFALMDQAWVCPVTRRLLDTTLHGITPYLPEKQPSDANTRCHKVRIPVYDQAFGRTTDDMERIRRGRRWIRKQQVITELREEGVWSNLHDRVIEMAPYFTAAEHSAQQPAEILDRYEKAFKEGDVNLLSCSTTMEMGIDIGGISQVAMNNVPPHPANYLQRAGRAGRRQEARSLSMTLCKANPLDQAVFANSRWAFDTSIPVPRVSLDSPVIIQRHVHSYLLTRFLSDKLSTSRLEQIKLNCAVFFGGEDPWFEQYCAWCDDFSPESNPELAAGLNQLIRYSLVAAQPLQRRTRKAAEQMRALAERWQLEWQHLEDERLEFIRVIGEQAPACKAIVFRQKRLVEEYLLRELATQGYLPAYGFPSHIAAFDNMTVDRFKARKAAAESREDNRYQRRDLASRDVVTALREYAPGAEVVMNGLVYQSAGITLNWHIPADAEQSCETQEIRYAWRCKKCGASGSSHSLSMVGTCSSCSQEIEKGNILEFLEPAGFAVDFFSKPDNDINVQQFVPVESPWINAGGEWTCLANPELGRFRITTTGHIFHHSRGIHGEGYALCLACGRAEPMMPGGELPKRFQTPHRKLRRAKDEDSFCSASDYAIKQGISLGHELRTDMLELQLKNNAGVWLDDYAAARTIAVALRDSLAELIGVQAIELGCEVKQSKPEHESVRQSILIYDTHAAGYASRAEGMFDVLFKEAHRKLCCPKECDSACPHCVLDFDQRFALEHLDRHEALKWFDEAWLNSLQVPEDYAFFGPASFPEYRKISEAIRYAVSRCGCTGVRCYTGGASDTWEISVSSLRTLAYGLAGQNIAVEIVLPEQSVSELDAIDRTILAGIADHPHISFFSSNEVLRAGKGYVIAETVGGKLHARWAGRNISSLAFNRDWGRGEQAEDFLVRGDDKQPAVIQGTALSPDTLRPVMTANSDRVLNIHQELNGPIKNFGYRFWNHLLQQHPASKELLSEESNDIRAVRYSDRYIKNPITVAMFAELICGLRDLVGQKRWTNPALSLVTMNIQANRQEKPQSLIWHDWQENQSRERVVKELLMSCNINNLSVFNRDIRQIEHRRSLTIEFSSKKRLDIFFDQGLSYWQSARSIPFDFSQSLEQQCQSIRGILDNESNRIEGSDVFPTVLSMLEQQCQSIRGILDNESNRIEGSDVFPTVLSIQHKR